MANEPAPRPDWLDDDLLKTCLINSKELPQNTNVDIQDVKLTYVVAKGENYMSIIYRVTFDHHIIGRKTETESFVIKVSHDTEPYKQMAKEAMAFAKETDMYVNIMPKLSKLLKTAGIDSNISCRCIYSAETSRDLLVMEDLNLKGYVLANRLTGLDLAHTKVAIDNLARVHAASKVDIDKNGTNELYIDAPFDKMAANEFMLKFFEDAMIKKIENVVSELNKYSKYKKHVDFYKKFEKLGFNFLKTVWKRNEGGKFNALNHGDCWVNNMMFKYNEDGSVQNVLLIDLQVAYHSSTAIDFWQFFFSSTNDDVKRNHFIDVQKFYIEKLTLYLKKLNYAGEIPTFEDFDKELRRLFLIAIFTITSFNAMVLQEYNEEQKDRNKTEAFEIEEVMEITNKMSNSFTRVLLLSIDVLEENGYFDSWLELNATI